MKFFLIFFLLVGFLIAQNLTQSNNRANLKTSSSYDFTFGVVKYQGGGDWYEGKVGVIELMEFANSHDLFKAYPEPKVVDLAQNEIYNMPLIYMTGHGDWKLSLVEKKHLKRYLELGGLLFINDDYGMDVAIRREMKKVFPSKKWLKLPSNHPVYNIYYSFKNGAPKIHKHDGGPPEIYALYYDGKVAVLYTKNTDIGDGWAPYQVHKDSQKVRKQALKFGFNIILYSLTR